MNDINELIGRCEHLIATSDNMPSYRLLSDYFELVRKLSNRMSNRKRALEKNATVQKLSAKMAAKLSAEGRTETAVKFYDLRKRSLLFAAHDDFDSYLIYLEWNRPPEKKFYQPRRKILRTVVRDLQELEDDKLDFLAVSMPPRVGKSTLGIFYVTWLMGRHPELANVMSGHSDKLTKGFYKEVLSILKNSDDYLWNDVFPNCSIAKVSAEEESIDINSDKRFPTLTCRSISGTLTGAVEVGRLLYVDDIIEDLEEALNVDRLENKYNAYLNQLKDRKKDKSKELHIGTRWAVGDVIGRIKEQYEDNPRYRFRVIPALDNQDESNFDYPYGLGFSTEYYRDMRDSIDNATWCAKYLGDPYVREGLLFPKDELNRYNGVLPDGSPDMVVSICDVAWGGGDDLFMPFAYIYGDDVYIDDLICNNGDKTVTRPIVLGKMKKHRPHKTRFEANNGGEEYAEYIDKKLKKENIRLNISHRRAENTTSKMARIIQYAPDIKKFHFRDDKHCSSEYRKAMQKLVTFIQNGKNKHDDVPDGLAQLADFIYNGGTTIKIGKRPF